jgi:regulator of CtrA degradation
VPATIHLVYANHERESVLRKARELIVFVAHEGGQRRMNTSTADDDTIRGITIQSFTGSALFERTFDEGMALVEETAKYLDGRGRQESKDLPRKAALLYAGESMRVTTRLMQAASWLLVQRAVHDGDMEAEDAHSERYRLGSKEICLGGNGVGIELLPATLRDLLTRSDNLYRRIARLDDVLFAGGLKGQSGVQAQMGRLEKAFGGEP